MRRYGGWRKQGRWTGHEDSFYVDVEVDNIIHSNLSNSILSLNRKIAVNVLPRLHHAFQMSSVEIVELTCWLLSMKSLSSHVVE